MRLNSLLVQVYSGLLKHGVIAEKAGLGELGFEPEFLPHVISDSVFSSIDGRERITKPVRRSGTSPLRIEQF
jgi:hypothetical protein